MKAKDEIEAKKAMENEELKNELSKVKSELGEAYSKNE